MNTKQEEAEELDRSITGLLKVAGGVPQGVSGSTQDADSARLVHDLRSVAESTPMRAEFAAELEARLLEDPSLAAVSGAAPAAGSGNIAGAEGLVGWLRRVRDVVQRPSVGTHRGRGRVARELGLAGALVVLLAAVGVFFLLARTHVVPNVGSYSGYLLVTPTASTSVAPEAYSGEPALQGTAVPIQDGVSVSLIDQVQASITGLSNENCGNQMTWVLAITNSGKTPFTVNMDPSKMSMTDADGQSYTLSAACGQPYSGSFAEPAAIAPGDVFKGYIAFQVGTMPTSALYFDLQVDISGTLVSFRYDVLNANPSQPFFINMGNNGAGIPAIEPQATASSTQTPGVTLAEVEQYVGTHNMQGSLITVSYMGTKPTVVSIDLVQFRDVYSRYMPGATQRWQWPNWPDTMVYMVELHGTFHFAGAPSLGDWGTYHTGVWVFDATTGYDLLEGGVPRTPQATATVTEVPPSATAKAQGTPTRVPGSAPVSLVRDGDGFRLDVYEGAARLRPGPWLDSTHLLMDWYSTHSGPNAQNSVHTYSTYVLDIGSGALTTLPDSDTNKAMSLSPDGKHAVLVDMNAGTQIALLDVQSNTVQRVLDPDRGLSQWAGADIDLSGFKIGTEIFVYTNILWAGNDVFAVTLRLSTEAGDQYSHSMALLVDVSQKHVRVLSDTGRIVAAWPDGSVLVQAGRSDGAIELFRPGDTVATALAAAGLWRARWAVSPDGKEVAWMEMTPPAGDSSQQAPLECCSDQNPPAFKDIALFDSVTGTIKSFDLSGTAWPSPGVGWSSGDAVRWSNDGSSLYYSTHATKEQTTLWRMPVNGQGAATALVAMHKFVGLDMVAEANDGSLYYTVIDDGCQNCARLIHRYSDAKSETLQTDGATKGWLVDKSGRLEELQISGILVTDLHTGQAHEVDFAEADGVFRADTGWSGVADLVPISPDGLWAAYAGSISDAVIMGPDGRPDRGRTAYIKPIK